MTRKAVISKSGSETELGIITSITDNINTTMADLKIPMLEAEKQFAMDTGSTESLTVTAHHINGDTITNSTWLSRMIALINRWQAETNGCKFIYTPDDDLVDYIASYNVNCYIKSLTLTWDANVPEVIQASLSLNVGTMMGGISSGAVDTPTKDMKIYMTSTWSSGRYIIFEWLSGDFEWKSFVESMKVTGGFNQPFESMEITIPRRYLETIKDGSSYPFTQANSISAGNNIFELNNAMGWGKFIVSGVKTTKTNYTFQAYSVAELFKAKQTTQNYGTKVTKTIIPLYTYEIGVDNPTQTTPYGGVSVVIRWYDEVGNYNSYYLSPGNEKIVNAISGTVVTIIASPPSTNWEFDHWEGDYYSTDQTFERTVTGSLSLALVVHNRTTPSEKKTGTPPQVSPTGVYRNINTTQVTKQWYSSRQPFDIICDILQEGVDYREGANQETATYTTGKSNHHGRLILFQDQDNSFANQTWDEDDVFFPAGTNAWYVLQICAYYLNAKIYFADGNCYIIRLNSSNIENWSGYPGDSTIELGHNGTDYQSLMGTPTIGSDKVDNVINTLNVKYGAEETVVDTTTAPQTTTIEVNYEQDTFSLSDSVIYYGARASNKVFFGIRSNTIAERIAKGYLYYTYIGGQSLTFKILENKLDGSNNPIWSPRFTPMSFPRTIHDEINDFTLDANVNSLISGAGTVYQTTAMVLYERHFPEGYTTYTFGPQSPTELSLKIAQIDSTLKNNG